MIVDENGNLVDTTENAEEQTAEETVETVEEEPAPEKVYTEEEFNNKLDELLAKKIARKEAKIRKELEREYEPYKELGTVVNAGLGTEDIAEATNNLRDFYTQKGVTIPSTRPTYSERDIEILANSEAQSIIDAGYEDVVEEVDRLAKIGADKMTAREKQVFSTLAEYRTQEERRRDLAKEGVGADVYDSEDFKTFAAQFNTNTPIKNIYKLYTKSDTTSHEKIGSMKNGNTQEEKDYYTPEEVDRLTEKDYDDPKIFEKVRRSMQKW